MNHTQQILEMAKQNNGVVTAAMIGEAGLSRGVLKYLADLGKLEKPRGAFIYFLTPGRMSLCRCKSDSNAGSSPWRPLCSSGI